MRYYIRQHGKHVSGPFDLDAIYAWIKEGKVRGEMEFSVDRLEWIWGLELIDLFPPDRKRRRARRVR